jgi:hypothetical protein
MQDQRFVLIVVQEPFLTVQLHFHITVDFIEAPILLVGKPKILLRQALHLQLVRLKALPLLSRQIFFPLR